MNIIAENKGIKEPHKIAPNHLVNAINRYNSKRKSYRTRRKFKKIYPKFVKKQNILEDDLRKAKKLQNMSHDDLKKLAKLRDIKNHDILTKEDLIYTLLRSEKKYEDNYERYISNNTADELRSRINIIRMLLARLVDIITKKDR